MRFAVVRNANHREHLEAYLPENYKIIVFDLREDGDSKPVFIIAGVDNAGWTLDDYVIPRLASGLIFAQEIENYVEIGKVRYAKFEGKLVIVEALAVNKVQVRTINDGGLYPEINKIPVEFRLYLKEVEVGNEKKWKVDFSSVERKDKSWPENEPTQSQISKIYDFARTQASHLGMDALKAGQQSYLRAEIRNVDRQIERLQEEIKDLEEKRHQFDLALDR